MRQLLTRPGLGALRPACLLPVCGSGRHAAVRGGARHVGRTAGRRRVRVLDVCAAPAACLLWKRPHLSAAASGRVRGRPFQPSCSRLAPGALPLGCRRSGPQPHLPDAAELTFSSPPAGVLAWARSAWRHPVVLPAAVVPVPGGMDTAPGTGVSPAAASWWLRRTGQVLPAAGCGRHPVCGGCSAGRRPGRVGEDAWWSCGWTSCWPGAVGGAGTGLPAAAAAGQPCGGRNGGLSTQSAAAGRSLRCTVCCGCAVYSATLCYLDPKVR